MRFLCACLCIGLLSGCEGFVVTPIPSPSISPLSTSSPIPSSPPSPSVVPSPVPSGGSITPTPSPVPSVDVTLSPSASPTVAGPSPSASISPKITQLEIGINVSGLSDASSEHLYSDAMKTSRSFTGPTAWASYTSTVPLDAQGWPMTDFSSLIFTAQDPAQVSGTYQLSYSGDGVVKALGGSVINCSKSVLNTLSLGVLSAFVSCDVVVNSGQLVLSFTGTTAGAKNIALLRPNTRGLFNPAFLGKLAPFSVIRAMDLLHTNSSPIVEWKDRCQSVSCVGRDMNYEDLISLVNQTKKDLWLNIPAQASDDYIVQLSALLKSQLSADRKIYVEYSNEVWNAIFKQTAWNSNQAKLDVAAGDTQLSDGGTDPNVYYWGWKRVAKRLMTATHLLQAALGPARVRPVLSMQVANTMTFLKPLQFIAKYYGDPKTQIWGIAGAPYISSTERNNPLATQESLTAGMQASVNGNHTRWSLPMWDGKTSMTTTTAVQLAKYYGVPLLSYEIGLDTHGSTALPVKISFNRSMEAGGIVKQALTNWVCDGGGLANYFALSGPQTQYGSWGALESIEQITSPKYQALVEISGGVTCP